MFLPGRQQGQRDRLGGQSVEGSRDLLFRPWKGYFEDERPGAKDCLSLSALPICTIKKRFDPQLLGISRADAVLESSVVQAQAWNPGNSSMMGP